MQTIYYVYEKTTGKFAGSGTPYIDNEIHGCTTTGFTADFENFEATYDKEADQWTVTETTST